MDAHPKWPDISEDTTVRGYSHTSDLSHARPAHILNAGWDRGKTMAPDLTITSPKCSAILSESCHQAGAAAHSNGPKCQGWAGSELHWQWIHMEASRP